MREEEKAHFEGGGGRRVPPGWVTGRKRPGVIGRAHTPGTDCRRMSLAATVDNR